MVTTPTGNQKLLRWVEEVAALTTPDRIEWCDGSVFRMLRQGQRVVFELDGDNRATRLRLGSEVDMASPDRPPSPRD